VNHGNYLKTPIGSSLARIAQQVVATAIQQLGKALPCSVVSVAGQIVTVKFEVNAAGQTLPSVTIPILTSVYDWIPVQPGDTGMTVPADAYLGGISGLGGGVASLTPRANLSALGFVPCARAAWSVPNADQRLVQGPQGAVLRDIGNTAAINIEPSNITAGANSAINVDSGGTITIQAATAIYLVVGGTTIEITAGGITEGGIAWGTHVHTYIPGSGSPTETGPPEMP
jgi:hypothetical protein